MPDKPLRKKPAMVPLTTGNKKTRGWLLYQCQATTIMNSRGISKGITMEPKKPQSTQVRAFVITDPHYVDYNPPPEPVVCHPQPRLDYNPFEYRDPVFLESSSVEEPAHVCDSVFHNRRKV